MDYSAPTSIAELINCLDSCKSPHRFLAGGTDLLVQLRAGSISPATIINLKQIPETRSITVTICKENKEAEEGDSLLVGAAVTGAEFNEHSTAAALWPGLAEAFDLIGSTQIQGRATLGGNLCNGSPAADSVPAMIAAGAVARIISAEGERRVPVEEIITGPGQTCLSDKEVIVSFTLPARPANSGDAYLRMIPRTEMDIAIVGVGINLSFDNSKLCTQARVSLGAAAPTPLLLADAANALIGKSIDEQCLEILSAAVSSACRPINDKRGTIEYRKKIAGVLAKRVAKKAMERALAN